MSNTELVKAYRSLYRSALRAVQFSKPARYVVRDQLRAAFRGQRTTLTSAANNEGAQPFDPERIRRTVWFLNAAAASRGIEHRVLSNLLKTAYWRRRRAESQQLSWTNVHNTKKKKPVYVYSQLLFPPL
ncbi:hypothetical protein SBRCBS47491_000359 [Sporothrix bragantina]|uniref:Mitochondrial zinc maintenance protein 1, mitochondrial n=1 Tax=Sporothrix bragantina TaxID=671064 RepID=A0ABP0APR2_9PEZI